MKRLDALERLRILEAGPSRTGWLGARPPPKGQKLPPGWKGKGGGWASADDPDPKDAVDPDDVHWSGPGYHRQAPPPDAAAPDTKFIHVRGVVGRNSVGHPIYGTVKVDRDVFAQWTREHGLEPYEPVAVPAPKAAPRPTWTPGEGPADVKKQTFRLHDQCPAISNFVVKFEGARWPGPNVAITVVRHIDYSNEDIQQWLRELAETWRARGGLNATAKKIVRGLTLQIPLKEMTSKGLFGPAVAAYGCREITRGFDDVAGFVTMIERSPDKAKALMAEMKDELIKFGEVRWRLMRAV